MAQIIIYTGVDGNVNLCVPSPQYMEETGSTIEDIMAKDCPPGAIIVDDSIFPQDVHHEFFNAWELNGTTITVNVDKSRAIRLKNYNYDAINVAQRRQTNTFAGIPNNPDDATFLAKLSADRAAIAAATTVVSSVLPSPFAPYSVLTFIALPKPDE